MQEDLDRDEWTTLNIDFGRILRKVLKYWWVFAAFLVVSLVISIIYNKCSQDVYRAGMTILLKDENNMKSAEMYQLTEGFGLSREMVNLANQKYILRSPKIIGHALKNLDFDITYMSIGKLKDVEVYGYDQMIRVRLDSLHVQPLGATFTLSQLSNGSFEINVKGQNVRGYNYLTNRQTDFYAEELNETFPIEIGKKIVTNAFSFTVEKYSAYSDLENFSNPIAFYFNDPRALVSQWVGSMSVYIDENGGTLANISVVGKNVSKLITFLNAYHSALLDYNLEKKNERASRTLMFLSTRISDTADSLQVAAERLRNFKVKNNFAGSTQYASNIQSIYFNDEKQLQELTIQRQYLLTLLEQLNNGENLEDYIATALNADNSLLQSQLREIIALQSIKEGLKDEKENNPYKKQIADNEQLLRNNIKTLVSQTISVYDYQISNTEKSMKELVSQVNGLSHIESEYQDLEREYKILDGIYTFLLQKQAETQIAKASNTEDSEMIDEPSYQEHILPKGRKNTTTAVAVGLLIPLIFIVLQEVLNRKIRSTKDLKRILPDAKIIGMVPFDKLQSETPLLDNKQSIISESFRSLRTKMNFIAAEKEKKVIMISSCNESEGKTFCAVNIAIGFALSGKKTLIINYDLRRPRIEKVLEIERTKRPGLSEYLSGAATKKEIIAPCRTENLFMIPAGTIPPNPAELIGTQRNKDLLSKISNDFDIVILDTAPIGNISDAQLLQPYADIFVFVVMNNRVEYGHMLETYEQISEHSKNVCIVFNGATETDREYRYYYSNSYYTSKH